MRLRMIWLAFVALPAVAIALVLTTGALSATKIGRAHV